MDKAPYDCTTGELANASETTVQTIIKYCDLGLLDHIRLRNGSRLLRRGQEDRVRQIRADNTARRGRYERAS
jgi:DNA-binding transcriptional MerR regulator